MKKLLLVALGVAFGMGSLSASAEDPKKPEEKKKPDPAAAFKRLDKDGDGKLTKDEFLAGRKTDEAKEKAGPQFDRRDKNKDGALSLEEFSAMPTKKPKKPA